MAIAAWHWPAVFTGEARDRGIRLRTSRWRRPAPDTAPVRAKASSLYSICTLARDEAETAGFDDALLLDRRGLVAEATGANIFLAAGGVLYTPIADCFLAGITRQTVMDLAAEAGVRVVEQAIRPEDIEGFDECFLTGTAYEVQPVRAIDDVGFEVGKLGRSLAEAYARVTRGG